MISSKYTESGKAIKKGDRICLDARKGQVKKVCLAGTKLAKDYSCSESGGLLILFDDEILELHDFGGDGVITQE
jgi:hypothetical protein